MTDNSIKGIRAYIVTLAKQVSDGEYGEYVMAEQYASDRRLTVELIGRLGVSRFSRVQLVYVVDEGDSYLCDYSVEGWMERNARFAR